MLRSQLPAATTRHLGNWNTIWENDFLDYTSSVKDERNVVILRKRKTQLLLSEACKFCPWRFFLCPSPCHPIVCFRARQSQNTVSTHQG